MQISRIYRKQEQSEDEERHQSHFAPQQTDLNELQVLIFLRKLIKLNQRYYSSLRQIFFDFASQISNDLENIRQISLKVNLKYDSYRYFIIYSFISSQMTQPYKQALIQADLKATFLLLKNAFPDLEKVPLPQSITASPFLAPLAKRLKLNIPIDAYPSGCIALYKQINDDYLRHALNLGFEQIQKSKQSDVSFISREEESNLENGQRNKKSSKRQMRKCKISFLELKKYIRDFNMEEQKVSQDLIQMGRVFKSWQVQQTSAILSVKPSNNKKETKQESADIKFGRQKKEDVKIVFGKNISLECKIMRHEIINRAQNNKLLSQKMQLSEVEKKEIQMNFILNRITEEYFQDFREELTSYAQSQIYSFTLSQKIIEKSMQEHNFIQIYSKLVKSLKSQNVALQGSKVIIFKHIFVQKLQQIFYEMVRNSKWECKEQLLKKQLLGLSMFLGELFCNRFLSDKVFPDIFYQLMHKYIIEYYQNREGKYFYFETYIECVIKLIEKMSSHYDRMIEKSNTKNLEYVVSQIFDTSNPINFNFSYICDYVQVLKMVNAKLPSQRFKITFLLQDFRRSKAIKQDVDNSQAEVLKRILAIDINQNQDIQRITSMIANIDLEKFMKEFFFQFAEGNMKRVNKNIEIYKIMAEKSNIAEVTLKPFKENVEVLYLIDSDFPFLAQGIAKIMRIICDVKKIDYYELQLGQDSYQDEEVKEFLQKIQYKYFKISMED